MKQLRKSSAFLVLLVFLISALMPVSALAASGSTQQVENAAARAEGDEDAPATDDPGSDEPTGPVTTDWGDISADGKSATIRSSLKGGDTKTVRMLVNAKGYVLHLDAVELPEAPMNLETEDDPDDRYSGSWSTAWTATDPDGETVRVPASATGLKWSSIDSSMFNKVGKWTFKCTGTWSPAQETAPPIDATFVIDVQGMGLKKAGLSAQRTYLDVVAQTSDEGDEQGHVWAEFPLEAEVETPEGGTVMEYPESAIDFGPRQMSVTSFEWKCNRDSLSNWAVTSGRTPTLPVDYKSDLEKGTNSLLMQVDGANFTAGVAQYTCSATGVGVEGSIDFEARVTPFLMAIKDRRDSKGTVDDTGDEDRTKIALKYNYQPTTTVPLSVEWSHDIGVEEAKYVWREQDGSALGTVVQDSQENRCPLGEMSLPYQLSVTEDGHPKVFTCEVECTGETNHLAGSALKNTQHTVTVFSDTAPPTVIIQRVTKGMPTPIMDEILTVNGGVDLTFRAQIQGTGTDNDQSGLTFRWRLFKADGSNGELKDYRTDTITIENVTAEENDGDEYVVEVTNEQGFKGEASIKLTVNPTMETPQVRGSSTPDNNGGKITRAEKKSITMRAEVTNAVSKKALSFVWQEKAPNGTWTDVKNGGKTDPTGFISEYTIASPTIATHDGMQYRCMVTTTANDQSSLPAYTSPEFTLQILPQTGMVEFVEPVQDQTYDIESGTGLDLVTKAETDQGQAPLYQWYHVYAANASNVGDQEIGNEIPGATKENYATGRLRAGFHKYTCRATNKSDSERFADRVFKINVKQAPDQPIVNVKGDLDRGAMVGETVTFEVEARTLTGAPVTYKWERRSGDKGSWTAVTGGARRTLTLRSVQTKDDNTQLRCVVTNDNVPDSFFESDIITLHVWRPEDVPEIIEQPKDLRILTGSQGASNATLVCAVTTKGKDPYEFEWYYRKDESAQWVPTELQWDEQIESDQARAVLKVPDSEKSVGEYYCVVTNPGGNPKGAQVKSDIAKVEIMDRHVPLITTQPPEKQYTSVGNTAMLHCLADVEPAEPLIYTWQTSPDGGETWRNCTGADGDGYGTETFTTQTITEEMLGYALYFRCQVAGQDHGVVTYSRTTMVIPKEPSPEIKTIRDTFLRIEVDRKTGDRYLTGHTVGKTEDALTPVAIRRALDLDGIKGASVEISLMGKPLEDTDPVPTGTTVTLLDSKGIPLDDVTVVIMGDLLGSAESSVSQIVALAKHVKGDVKLKGAYEAASDHNKNGKSGEVSDLVAQAKIFKAAGGTPEVSDPDASPDPEASASADPSASASASARPSASTSSTR